MTRWLVMLGLVVLGLGGCGGEGQGERTRESCTPGEAKACTCPDGQASSKICGEQGDSYFPCQCQLLVDVGGDTTSDAKAEVPTPDAGPDAPADVPADPGPDACQAACVERQCGPDGCGGSCGACPAGAACDAAGRCHSATCGATPFTVTGQLVTALGTLSFDTVSVTASHKQDVDPYEDGCLVEIVLDLRRGTGCHLRLRAAERVDAAGALEIREVSLAADSQCPGFPDDQEGDYVWASSDVAAGDVDPGVSKVPAANAASSCFPAALPVRLKATLTRQSPGPALSLALTSSTLVVSGDVTSLGSTIAHCPCAWSCAGAECGDDGCGRSCGSCECGEACQSGACAFVACDAKACGPDGCGGSCGACTQWPGSYCQANGSCGCQKQCAGKDCGADGCGGSCGTCGCGEACQAGVCVFGACSGKECGSDGCGGSCGACVCGQTCQAGQCLDTACAGKQCGSDGCGGSCGSCGCGQACQAGLCVKTACAGKQCGSDGCGGSCGTCGCGSACQAGECVFTACAGRECGSDGCGGSCGDCWWYGAGYQCDANGACTCTPDCAGKVCGDDGCGGSCGSCQGLDQGCVDGGCEYQGGCFEHDTPGCDHCRCEECVCAMDPWCCENDWNWWCVDECTNDCQGCGACAPSCPADPTYCGSNGCNEACRTCPDGQACFADHCCTPQCAADQCGDDGCGGLCPTTCTGAQYCADFAGGDGRCHAGQAGDPCDDAGRCDDGVACTLDQCTPAPSGVQGAGTCAFDAKLCCTTDATCDDGDPVCTTDHCVPGPSGVEGDGTCVFTPTYAPGCCQASVLSFDVETALPSTITLEGSSAVVKWQVVDQVRYASPTHALYYGNAATLDYGEGLRSYGTLHVAALALPPATRNTLSFKAWFDTEDSDEYDVLVVTVFYDAGAMTVWAKPDLVTLKTWLPFEVDLSAFAGQTVDVELTFDTIDDTINATEGLYLDDVEVTSSCQPRTCTTAADCDDGLTDTSPTCVAGACAYALP